MFPIQLSLMHAKSKFHILQSLVVNFRDCETEAHLGIYCADLSEWGVHLKVKLCLIYGNLNYKNYYSDKFLQCPILIFQLNIAAEY